MTPFKDRIRHLTRLLPACALLASCLAGAQDPGPQEEADLRKGLARQEIDGPTFDAPNEDIVEFTDEWFELQSVGLRVRVPRGAEPFVETIGGRTTAGVTLGSGLGTVLMQSRETGQRDMPVLDLEKAVLRRTLLRSLSDESINIDIDLLFETSTGVSLGRSPAIPSAGRVTRPFYVLLKEDATSPMRGFSLVPLDPETFVFFQLVCDDEVFETSRQVFELIIKSATLSEGGAIDEERGGFIGAGEALLARLDASDYEAVIRDFPDQFERIYRPVPGGAEADEEEVGYRRVRAWLGSIADVETGEPSDTGPRTGYVLRVDGAVLLGEGDGLGGPSRADSRAVYFLSSDRSRESWKVDMSVHIAGSEKPDVWSEIGMRVGETMSVQVTSANRDSSTLRPSIKDSGYISRLEAYLMPQLLIHEEAEGSFAFYSYDQTAEINSLRTVESGRVEGRPGVWRVRTEMTSDRWESSLFNAYGRLVRSETSDDLVKRPIEFERLYRLWRSKGLPLD